MARNIAWVAVALLLGPGSSRAVGRDVAGVCERDQAAQQRGGQAPAGARPEKKPGEADQGHPPRPKWWIDPKLRAELGVTDQQSATVEQIWQKSLPSLHEGREKLTKLEDALSKLTDAGDEAAVVAQIDKVETLRAELNKARTLMIYRMNKVLSADQRAKVKAMYEPRDPNRRGSSPR